MNIRRKGTADWASSRGPVSEAELQEIGKLLNTLDIANVAGDIGTIHPPDHTKGKKTGYRVDLQSPSKTAYNVQVQDNSCGNPSTVACCMVPMELVTRMGAKGTNANQNSAVDARGSELLYGLHGALIRSARTIRPQVNDKGKPRPGLYELQVMTLEGSYSCGDVVKPEIDTRVR